MRHEWYLVQYDKNWKYDCKSLPMPKSVADDALGLAKKVNPEYNYKVVHYYDIQEDK